MRKLKMRKLNNKQTNNLKALIHKHLHETLDNAEEAAQTFKKIRKYGVNTMPEAVALYRANRK